MTNKNIQELASSRFYNKDLDDNDRVQYVQAQISRHISKMDKKRNKKYYENIAKELIETSFYKKKDSIMLCLGTRNNWERDCIIEATNGKTILSVDISPASNADIIADFNHIKRQHPIEAIFSNSIDHATQPNLTYINWLDCLVTGGTLIVDFDVNADVTSEADCSIFEIEKINTFLDFLVENKYIKSQTKKYVAINGYYRTIVTKA